MKVTLNNQTITITENEVLETLLKTNALLSKKGIAVAVNSTVVPKSNWSSHKLLPNDNIMVITATAGG